MKKLMKRASQAISVLAWKLIYGLRIHAMSAPHDDWIGGPYFWWCVGECATAGWEFCLSSNSGEITKALEEDPIYWADCEMEAWTHDE